MIRDCYSCAHAGADPDGPYCGHPEALRRSGFGLSFNVMRGPCMGMPEGPCGTDGRLWEDRRTPTPAVGPEEARLAAGSGTAERQQEPREEL
jgi:hypothetical protein